MDALPTGHRTSLAQLASISACLLLLNSNPQIYAGAAELP